MHRSDYKNLAVAGLSIETVDSVLCWLSTVDGDGQPDVSPKEICCAYGTERLLASSTASPLFVHNILADPQICVSYIDAFGQHGWKWS